MPVAQIKIVDPVGEALPAGETGELLAGRSTVVAGYWQRPTATDGWFPTGDVAVIESDGCLTIVDRLKDLAIRGGENVATVEVEAAIFGYPCGRRGHLAISIRRWGRA